MKKRNIIAKYLCCCLLLFIMVGFCGCADINYATIKNEDGQITETVTAILDSEYFNQQNKPLPSKQEILYISRLSMKAKYDEYLSTCSAEIIKYEMEQDFETATLYRELAKAVTVYEPFFVENNYYAKIEFANTTAYCLFYNMTEQHFVQQETQTNFLTNKIYFKGNLSYSINNGLYSLLKNDLKNYFPKFNEDSATLSYSYMAPARRYHSNADYIKQTEQGYLHTWNVDKNNQDKEIYFYLVRANRNVLYLIAIIISLIVAIILSIIVLIKFILRHNKNNLTQSSQQE